MITSKIIANGILRAVAVLVAVAVILYLLIQIQSILVYLVIALILTLIGTPVVKFLKRRLKFPHILAVALTLALFVAILAGIIMLFIPLIAAQGKNLSVLNATDIENKITLLLNEISSYVASYNIDAEQILKQSNLTSKLNLNFIPAFLNGILGTLSSFGLGLASVLFITFFFLKDRVYFFRGIKKIMPEQHEDRILNSLEKINHLLSRYFVGLLLQLFIIFVLYLIVLFIFGVQNAFVIAFLCAVLNIIPYIGPLIGSVFAAVLTMLGHLGENFKTEILPVTIYVMIGFWVVQIIDNNVSQPLIFSNSVKSHPLEIFLVILIAGFLSGILGMIVAIPLYTMLKVVAKEFIPNNSIVRILAKDI